MMKSRHSLPAAGMALGLALSAGTALAQSSAPQPASSADQPASGSMVQIPADTAREIARARSEAGDCVRIENDAERLTCYDEMMARRLSLPDRELPKRQPPGQAPGASSAAGQPKGGSTGLRGTLPVLPALGEYEEDDDRPNELLGDSSGASQAVRDMRRSLGSNLTDRWELDDDSDRGRFVLRPYKPMYMQVVDGTSSLNRSPSSTNPLNNASGVDGNPSLDASQGKRIEARFQLSFKSKVFDDLFGSKVDIWAAYTQMSLWQIYSGTLSRPFRETNYEPEVMAVMPLDFSLGKWRARMASVSLNHQSNGRPLPLSRSWNRVIFQMGLERNRWTLLVRPWVRIPESDEDDDNPDINDFLGRAEVVAVYRRGGHELSGTFRHTLNLGSKSRGTAGLDYSFPISSYLKGHVQLFHGYGFSLIDYNHRQTRFGLGVSLVQWL
ncbi:MAG: phospholipase A [Lautropia sp.]|nr:phospholipase A [Lautropia sp.]